MITENKHAAYDLEQMQSLPLEAKIVMTQRRIREWYEHWDGQAYVSFSGGKDSTVLLHLVREMYPEVSAVFVDTGLEYPEIREFVKTIDNVEWVKPKMPFNKVIDTYGYPIISKEIARDVCAARNKPCGKTMLKFDDNSDYCKKYGKAWSLSRYSYLLESPFKISNKCCSVMKKEPVKDYGKRTGKRAFIGTLAVESRLRKKEWIKYGCNAFNKTIPSSHPLSFWTEQDILQYIKSQGVEIASVYGKIIDDNKGRLKLSGISRTGCMFCMFGVHLEKEPNRFQHMKITHPKQYDYCIRPVEKGGLGLGRVLDYIGVKY